MSRLTRTTFGVASTFSRLLHVVLLDGNTDMTLSARAYIECQSSKAWSRVRRIVDLLFFFQESHCESAWKLEVENSKRTLAEEHKRTQSV